MNANAPRTGLRRFWHATLIASLAGVGGCAMAQAPQDRDALAEAGPPMGDDATVFEDSSIGEPDAAPTDTSNETRRLRYYVLPHPDDEIEAWSMVAGDSSHYIVFVLMTRGEQSGFCGGRGLESHLGERIPQPQPFANDANGGKWTETCARQRIDSWNYFMDEMGSRVNQNIGAVAAPTRMTGTPSGGTMPTRCDAAMPNTNCRPSLDFDLAIGPQSARVVFDLGDGDLTPQEVTWAIQTVRSLRSRFPVTAEDDIVGSSYRNAHASQGFVYDHPDHRAIHVALYNTDQQVPGPQWAATAAGDPDANTVLDIDPETASASYRVEGAGPEARRVGIGTVAYGWLFNPYPVLCASTRECVFAAKQHFWTRF